jgi:thiaminase/transcriptional activator TenA
MHIRAARLRKERTPGMVQTKVSFCEAMREENGEMWEAIRTHPFIRDVESGLISDDRLAYYFGQNVQYVDVAYRIHAIAAAKAPDEESMEAPQVSLRLAPDIIAHQRELFRRLGGDPDHLPEMAPANKGYTDHLLRVAYERDTVDLLTAFMPCPWTYVEIAREIHAGISHPLVAEWLERYAGDELREMVDQRVAVIDRLAGSLPSERLDQLRHAFRISMRYEWLFWDDAYNKREWLI